LAGDFDGVVRAAKDVPEAIGVDRREVAMYPHAGEAAPVCRFVALRRTPEAASHAGPGLANHEFTYLIAHGLAQLVHHVRRHARHGAREGAGLDRLYRRAADDAARHLRATRVIDDGAAAAADHIERPVPGARVPWLAAGADDAQLAEVVPAH